MIVWPGFGGFLLLVVFAIGLRWAGGRLLPLVMPPSRLASLGAGIVGGLAGHLMGGWLWPQTPLWGGLYVAPALAGAALFIVGLGVTPFLRILGGRNPF